MADKINAQVWLKNNYEDKKTSITKIGIGESIELEGELLIDGYSSLEKILLPFTKGITKITIANCPSIKVIIVNDNQITEIKGLDGSTNLQKLNFGENKVGEVDISKNIQLESLIFYGNPKNLKFVNGIKSLSKLVSLNSNDTFPIITLLEQASEADLKEVADKLKLEVGSKSKDDIKKEIIAEIEKNNQNKEKLNDPKNGLPDLLNEKGEIDNSKLEEMRNNAEKGKEYQKLLDEAANDLIKSEDKKKIDQVKLTEKLKEAVDYEEFKKNNPNLLTDNKIDPSKVNELKKGSEDNKALRKAVEAYFGGKKWEAELEVSEFQNQIEVNTNNKTN